jgi:N-acyl-D-amino-acid deacylase
MMRRTSRQTTAVAPIFALVLSACAAIAAGNRESQAGGGSERSPAAAPTSFDIVIRDGRVLDGAGNPWIRADIAIKDGRFSKIGYVSERGTREIDASGLYVSPGWIDMMDQSGSILPRNGLAENKLRQGVTTAIGGEAGTPVPASRIGEYFATLKRQGISINFGTYFSEAQVRETVLGFAQRPPTAGELGRMRAIMDTAMRAGALGMSTALIYPPGSYATTEELIDIARVAAAHGGIYASHVRGEGKEVLSSIRELIAISERAGLPGEIFHLKVADRALWGVAIDSIRQLVDSARGRGVDVAADMYLYTQGGTGLDATIPSWAFAGGIDSLVLRLRDSVTRAHLKRDFVNGVEGWSNLVDAVGGWDHVILANAHNASNAPFEGKTIASIAQAMHVDPIDAAWNLVLQSDQRVMARYELISEDDIVAALRFPWTSIGSDAGVVLSSTGTDGLGLSHPRVFGNATRLISRYVKERHVLSLEDAVRKMTSWPATRMRLVNRGVIKEGNWADVTVFDLDSLQDRATYDNPAEFSEGIRWVLVNGVVTVDQGHHTGARAGMILLGPGFRAVDR